MPLREGDAAPHIPVDTDAARPFDWKSIAGRRAVLYFYPKADTPG